MSAPQYSLPPQQPGGPQFPSDPRFAPAPRPARRNVAAILAAGFLVMFLLVCGGFAALAVRFADYNRQFDVADLAGNWMTMNVRYTIVVENGTPRVSTVVDEDDGERFQIENCRWDGTTLRWTLYVPSSGSRVEETLHPTRTGLSIGALNGTYSSFHATQGGNAGASIFTRRR